MLFNANYKTNTKYAKLELTVGFDPNTSGFLAPSDTPSDLQAAATINLKF